MTLVSDYAVAGIEAMPSFIRFPAELALALPGRRSPAERLITGLDQGKLIFQGADIGTAKLSAEAVERLRAEGAEVYADIQFSAVDPTPTAESSSVHFWDVALGAAGNHGSMADVMDHIHAPLAWTRSRGRGVTIAIVDTGICGTLPDFPVDRRSQVDPGGRYKGQHWVDLIGHGSMCAAIAAGSGGSISPGVAPEATILAARTDLTAVDIASIYGGLISARRSGAIPGPLVISNSWALYTCQPPDILPRDHPFMDVILQAIVEGIVVVFAAGNNHGHLKCGYRCDADGPNSIWGPNSHDRVLSVGTVDRLESNRTPGTDHCNSSRGPGEWASRRPKPDCVAPTYGRVVWGCETRDMPWWGTSGACPQVAGLAALLLSQSPELRVDDVHSLVLDGCRAIPGGPNCVGRGIIDCEASMRLLANRLVNGTPVR